MDLYKEILVHALQDKTVQVSFSNFAVDANQIVELACYKALNEIKAVIENETLDDSECFMKIEEIMEVFDSLGSSCAARHDTG